ncbi:hypothetical protein PR048_011648 [Dryococelus australis]|uniref:Uncharacterized protein n=1 Tax=Dryococelus australis TaxID=614101 RepID=A0ABQ9HM56_9NEOP|nr:hypothetical protein PR048_011648 [Dryococelus australis]
MYEPWVISVLIGSNGKLPEEAVAETRPLWSITYLRPAIAYVSRVDDPNTAAILTLSSASSFDQGQLLYPNEQDIQGLRTEDHPARVGYSQWPIESCGEDPFFISKILLTDEAGPLKSLVYVTPINDITTVLELIINACQHSTTYQVCFTGCNIPPYAGQKNVLQ